MGDVQAIGLQTPQKHDENQLQICIRFFFPFLLAAPLLSIPRSASRRRGVGVGWVGGGVEWAGRERWMGGGNCNLFLAASLLPPLPDLGGRGGLSCRVLGCLSFSRESLWTGEGMRSSVATT